jgi:hypothetical protein
VAPSLEVQYIEKLTRIQTNEIWSPADRFELKDRNRAVFIRNTIFEHNPRKPPWRLK